MRHHGNLTRWNDDRGFGFIAPAGGTGELFVHISAFPRDGRRPVVGEVLTYLSESGPDGKLRAVCILRPGSSGRAAAASRQAARRERTPARSGGLMKLLTLCAIVAIGGALYTQFGHRIAPAAAPATAAPSRAAPAQASPYKCDGRSHCSQMTSCAEATYFLRHCPNTKMDGNGDGVPCEMQWCK
jgi:cold shock CspA family protein